MTFTNAICVPIIEAIDNSSFPDTSKSEVEDQNVEPKIKRRSSKYCILFWFNDYVLKYI